MLSHSHLDEAMKTGANVTEAISAREPATRSAALVLLERGAPALLILLLPVVLLAANSSWIFTGMGWIDAWVSFGYFQHLAAYKSTLFPDLYYGSRLPWILPGNLAYRLFEPKTANYVLHFTFYYLAAFSLYYLLKRAAGRRNALLGAVLFGTYGPFLSAIGRDYVDGAGMTYFLLALAAAARATETRRQLWLMISGIAGLAMCYTNLFLVAFLPFVPGLYLFMTYAGVNRRLLDSLKDVAVWFGAGAVVVSAVLGGINYTLDRHFWFYWPSIHWMLVGRPHPNPWVTHGWGWMHKAGWLGIPAAATLASLAYVVRDAVRRILTLHRLRTFFVLQFLASAAGMMAWQVIGSTGLSLSFYASYLIPPMFLAIGCLLPEEENEGPMAGRKWTVLMGSIAVMVWCLHLADGGLAQMVRAKAGLLTVTGLAAAALLANVLFRRNWLVAAVAVAGLGLYQLDYSGLSEPSAKYEADWQRVVEGAAAVWPYEQQGPVSFWYDATRSHGQELYSMNSVYLWGFTYVGTRFPAVEVPSRLVDGATIVMAADSPLWVERANEVLRAKHLRGTPKGTYTVGHDAGSFQIGFLKLETDAAP